MRDSKKSESIINFLTSGIGDPVAGCQSLPDYLGTCLDAWPSWWSPSRGGLARARGRLELPEPQVKGRESLKCFLVLTGTNRLDLEDGRLDIRAGEMGVVGQGWPHEEQWLPAADGCYLHLFIGVMPGRLAVNLAGSGGGFGLRSGDHTIYQGASIPFHQSRMLVDLLEFQAVHRLGDASWSRVIQQVFLRGLLEKDKAVGSPLVRRCRAIISATATNPELSVKALAVRLGCHPDYLSRRFIEETGSGLMETVRALRLQVARDLLENSWLTVAEVAALSGWKDHSYFSLIFRRAFGCSPLEHRRLHR